MAQYDLTISTGSNFTKRFLIKKSDDTVLNLSGYSASMYIIKSPGVLSSVVFTNTGGQFSLGGATGLLTLTLTPTEIASIDGNFFKIEVTDMSNYQTEVITGNLFLLDETKVGVEYLINKVRLMIGDTNVASYRYMDEWIKSALILGVQTLQMWWRERYYITENGIVTRNPEEWYKTPVTNSVIEKRDEPVIVLMAAFLLLEGSLESSAYNFQSWKDAEVSFSNIESGRVRDANVKRLWDQILSYLTPPAKRLAGTTKMSLPGYKGNSYERETEY